MTVYATLTDHTNALWNIPGFDAAYGVLPLYSTNALHYDVNFVRCAVGCSNSESCPILDIGANLSEFWVHFDLYLPNNLVTAGLAMVEMWSQSKTLQLGLVENAVGITYDIRRSTNGTSFAAAFAGTFVVSTAVRKTVDIYVKIHASLGEIRAYVDGTLVYTFTGDTSTNGDNAVRYLLFRGGRVGNARYISQVVVTDVPTMGWKVQSLAPVTGAQEFSAWTGTYDLIDDFTGTSQDSVYTNTADAVVSFPLTDVSSTASGSGMIVQAVFGYGRFLTETGATPQDVELGLSMSSTFYPVGGTRTVGEGNGEILLSQRFTTNPSNGSGWTYSDVNAAQVAFKAKT